MPKRTIFAALVLTAGLMGAPQAIAADERLDDALAAYQSGDFPRAASLLAPLAEAGDAVAQHRLSVLHFYGKGVTENERLALDLARKSAAQGNTDAMYFLGTMFVFGDEAPKQVDDPDREAAKWYFEAARTGHAEAEYGLGLMFLAGKGVVQDTDQAINWIRRAADHGHAGARSFVASHGDKPHGTTP